MDGGRIFRSTIYGPFTTISNNTGGVYASFSRTTFFYDILFALRA